MVLLRDPATMESQHGPRRYPDRLSPKGNGSSHVAVTGAFRENPGAGGRARDCLNASTHVVMSTSKYRVALIAPTCCVALRCCGVISKSESIKMNGRQQSK